MSLSKAETVNEVLEYSKAHMHKACTFLFFQATVCGAPENGNNVKLGKLPTGVFVVSSGQHSS